MPKRECRRRADEIDRRGGRAMLGGYSFPSVGVRFDRFHRAVAQRGFAFRSIDVGGDDRVGQHALGQRHRHQADAAHADDEYGMVGGGAPIFFSAE